MPNSEGWYSVEFSNFSGGEYGRLGGEKAPQNTFHASNLIVTADGFLSPRPGLADITPVSMPTGKVFGLASTDTPGADGLVIIDDEVYLFDLFDPSVAPTSIGTLAVTPTEPVSIKKETTNRIFGVPGDKVYKVDPVAGTLTSYTSSPEAHDVEIYDAQLITAKSESSPRIEGSVPGDYNDWTEGRFADIGDNWQTTCLFEQRNSLVIGKRQGWYVLTGVLGDPNTQVIRKMNNAQGPLHPNAAARDSADTVWFWPLFRDDIGSFNGYSTNYTKYIGSPGLQTDGTTAAVPIKRGLVTYKGDLSAFGIAAVQAGTSQFMALQHNGVWTYHNFEKTISGHMIHDIDLERIVITDGGGTGVAAKIYTTYPQLDRPVLAADGLVRAGDDSDTPVHAYVTFPQVWVSGKSNPPPTSRIRQIVVDFEKYDTGISATNHFDVVLRSLGRNRAPDKSYTFTSSFDEDPTESTNGEHWRHTFNANGTYFSGGFEVTLDNIRGIRIQSVRVNYTVDGLGHTSV